MCRRKGYSKSGLCMFIASLLRYCANLTLPFDTGWLTTGLTENLVCNVRTCAVYVLSGVTITDRRAKSDRRSCYIDPPKKVDHPQNPLPWRGVSVFVNTHPNKWTVMNEPNFKQLAWSACIPRHWPSNENMWSGEHMRSAERKQRAAGTLTF